MTPTSSVGHLDTSVVIELPVLSTADLPAVPTISVITLAELSVGLEMSKTSDERQRRHLVLQHTEASFDPLPFDAACARRFAIVAGSLRQSGRKTQARAFACPSSPVPARNAKDFEGITGLDVGPVVPND